MNSLRANPLCFIVIFLLLLPLCGCDSVEDKFDFTNPLPPP